jgi:hypothetical protein
MELSLLELELGVLWGPAAAAASGSAWSWNSGGGAGASSSPSRNCALAATRQLPQMWQSCPEMPKASRCFCFRSSS